MNLHKYLNLPAGVRDHIRAYALQRLARLEEFEAVIALRDGFPDVTGVQVRVRFEGYHPYVTVARMVNTAGRIVAKGGNQVAVRRAETHLTTAARLYRAGGVDTTLTTEGWHGWQDLSNALRWADQPLFEEER